MTLLLTIAEGGRPGPVRACLCDMRCDKAWGVNGRRHFEGVSRVLSDDEDDVVYLADGETGIAPLDTGVYEAGQGKPSVPDHHTKWCLRECERSAVVDVGERLACFDLSKPLYNQPWRHDAHNGVIDLGRELRADDVASSAVIDAPE